MNKYLGYPSAKPTYQLANLREEAHRLRLCTNPEPCMSGSAGIASGRYVFQERRTISARAQAQDMETRFRKNRRAHPSLGLAITRLVGASSNSGLCKD
jgi:hypothetical protein